MLDIVTVTVNFRMRDKILAMLRSLFRDIEGTSLSVQPVIVDNASGDGLKEGLEKEFEVIDHNAPQPPLTSDATVRSPTETSDLRGGDADNPPLKIRGGAGGVMSDGSRQTVLFINAGANIGFGRGNNLGLKKFDAKYYFIANPDIVFLESQPRVIERLYQFMEAHPKVGILAPRLQLPDGEIQPSCMRFPRFLDQPIYRLGLQKKHDWARRRVEHLHMKDFDHLKTQPIDWATGAALFVRGSLVKEVGFFDERYFMYFEDTDLCRTFWSRGLPVYYKGDVVIQHGHERASAKVSGLKSVLLNPLTRIHIVSLMKYAWKWRGKAI